MTKAVLRRWYDEMWGAQNPDLVPELAGPVYVRHEMGGTRSVTAEEYQQQVAALCNQAEFTDLRYRLIAEDDHVVAIGTWKVDGNQWDWVQAFRAENGKLVETWLSGIGFESNWAPEVIRPWLSSDVHAEFAPALTWVMLRVAESQQRCGAGATIAKSN